MKTAKQTLTPKTNEQTRADLIKTGYIVPNALPVRSIACVRCESPFDRLARDTTRTHCPACEKRFERAATRV